MPDLIENKAMTLAIAEGKKSIPELNRTSPTVGAVLIRDGVILGSAFRGELGNGDHAEYTLFEKKLKDIDLRGATLFTTLEPCTVRSPGKIPCANRIIGRGIRRVFIGMLDPDPRIQSKGQIRLREAGIEVNYFPAELRDEVRNDNKIFMDKFRLNEALSGEARFNYGELGGLGGTFVIGTGEARFVTRWSSRSLNSVYIMKNGLRTLAVAEGYHRIEEITDGGVFPGDGPHQSPRVGDVVVCQNVPGNWAAILIVEVRARERNSTYDELTFEYKILVGGSSNFSH